MLRKFTQPILRIDDRLRRRNQVREYSSDPQCMFRMQPGITQQDATLSDGSVLRKGDTLVDLHLWNEHMPKIPPEGPTFAWARRLNTSFDLSLRQLAGFLSRHPEFDHVKAIRAYTAVATPGQETQLLRLMGHFGFESVVDNDCVSWMQRIHRRAENFFGLLLVLAVNPVTARISMLARVRAQMLLSRKLLNERYGAQSHKEMTHQPRQRRVESTGVKRAKVAISAGFRR